ncbi:acyl-CoA dehydrogenase [Paenibacillus baekrokdamisoli]|uniref:Acyl-CoA dehydrogenase n=1 Tax=Paenibacillus baekrokdamisoli TaxID=1712516 RepID=A0A3G9IVB0_9BACL|nr:acyl-CoA dehydrogenase family protein [Paenibacillus baekrokdamisoli]MBB3068217.1 alkylation response protein AidB-like acyl-CoA dehydrogenase [Paenibacillus baekrokdamisoli]BBH22740.1 acyl-CoA dehydrogenase [Paenibacillus baekrokdamisoli]
MAQTYRWGGRFVIEDMSPEAIVTPEDFTEEQRMIAEAARAFVTGEIQPRDAEIESLNYELTVELMRKAGELGLLGADVPEAYGGLGLDKVSTTLLAETLAEASSFALSVGAHVGIGTLPIVFFGTPQQKQRYLPDLAVGQRIAAYCLTEPASGSDALGARTTARLSPDGKHYVLNGSKIYITNAGFADLFIVYAKVDGEHFTAFIVERHSPGFGIGPEEHKMGIKGSSTCPLYFDDTPVPVENVLGQVGKGHLIAFNILNIGRFKLAAACVGGAKETIALAANYANTRKQFGRVISSFPLIGAKLADMNIITYVMESMVYRTAGWIDDMLQSVEAEASAAEQNTSTQADGGAGARAAKAISEYALECSILKVFATEALSSVADEGVQIHGGYGYIREYKIERIYRDARINRIFEGTNEINRLLIPGTLMKKALKGELPLLRKARALQSELLQPMPLPAFDEPLSKETFRIQQAKKIFLAVGGLAVQRYGLALEQQQEVLALLADMMIQLFAMESANLRTRKMQLRASANSSSKTENAVEMTTVFVQEAMERIERYAKTALAAIEEGDSLHTQLSILKKLTRSPLVDTVALKRCIASRIIRSEQYTI